MSETIKSGTKVYVRMYRGTLPYHVATHKLTVFNDDEELWTGVLYKVRKSSQKRTKKPTKKARKK